MNFYFGKVHGIQNKQGETMGINRKNENTISKPYDGITKILIKVKEKLCE